jgi:hypothetical protein
VLAQQLHGLRVQLRLAGIDVPVELSRDFSEHRSGQLDLLPTRQADAYAAVLEQNAAGHEVRQRPGDRRLNLSSIRGVHRR